MFQFLMKVKLFLFSGEESKQSPAVTTPEASVTTNTASTSVTTVTTSNLDQSTTVQSSLEQLNKLASQQQNTLAGTLGHTVGVGSSDLPQTVSTVMNGAMASQGKTGSDTPTNTMGQSPAQQASLNNNNNTVKVKSCAACGARICDRFLLHAMERYWHTGCLKCSCCQAQLGEIGTTCYAKAGMILCKNDYIRWVFSIIMQWSFSFSRYSEGGSHTPYHMLGQVGLR